jgi:hypothetical protein
MVLGQKHLYEVIVTGVCSDVKAGEVLHPRHVQTAGEAAPGPDVIKLFSAPEKLEWLPWQTFSA